MSSPSTLPLSVADANIESTKAALDASDDAIDAHASSAAKREGQGSSLSQEEAEILKRLEQAGYRSNAALSVLLQAQVEDVHDLEQRALDLLLEYESLGPEVRDKVRVSSKPSEPREWRRRDSGLLGKHASPSPSSVNALPKSSFEKKGKRAGAALVNPSRAMEISTVKAAVSKSTVLKSLPAEPEKSQVQVLWKRGILQYRNTLAPVRTSVTSTSSPRGPKTNADNGQRLLPNEQAENLPNDYDDAKRTPGARHVCRTPSEKYPCGYCQDALKRRYPLNQLGVRSNESKLQADMPGSGNSKTGVKRSASCTDQHKIHQKRLKHSSGNEEKTQKKQDLESDVEFNKMLAELQAWLDRRIYMPWLKSANPDEKALGAWVEVQRKRRCMLSTSRVSMLEGLRDWSWTPQKLAHKKKSKDGVSDSHQHQDQAPGRTVKPEGGAQHEIGRGADGTEIQSHASETVKDEADPENYQQKLHKMQSSLIMELAQQQSKDARRTLLRKWQLMYHPDKNDKDNVMASALFRWVQHRWNIEFRSRG
eukprot:gnl/MRDRNA2_/MRDRNA2_85547_c0_seq1.p1 gnl/MRDRNA2_/MRDRNA2_85547_c0~~gnl/MRDRNA2_/MRDRNA2_85547_c0_seq1.p1  ORF type:complete len:536 (+),score=126.16 gnl/MRDRNA2_/MRDRNA2_85547_c0_seq1:106-1713(+)